MDTSEQEVEAGKMHRDIQALYKPDKDKLSDAMAAEELECMAAS